jgi:competence protein ComFC
MSLYTVKRTLLGILYPNRCPFCGVLINAERYFCAGCLKLNIYKNNNVNTFYCIYNDSSKPLLINAKERADGYAISACARLLYDTLIKNGVIKRIDSITGIPARKASLKKRGYNFPSLLAKEIALLSGKKYFPDTLFFTREIKEQKGLSADERVKNLKGAFGVKNKCKLSGNVLIIDDVSTTGATLNEAKRVVFEHAENVYIAAFAKTLQDE